MRTARTNAIGPSALALGLVLYAAPVCADVRDDADEPEPYRVYSLHAQTGLGGGNAGLAFRVSGEGTYWLGSAFGVGATLGLLEQIEILARESSAVFVAPVLALRTEGSSIWLFTGSGGYAWVTTEVCGLDDCDAPGGEHAGYASFAIAHVYRGRTLEIGPALRFESVFTRAYGTDYAVTLNLVLGAGG